MGQQLDEQQRQEQGTVRPGHPAQSLESAGPIIEGAFTYDALEDLFLYLCSRRETLTWQLTTLAGSFTLLLDQGQPADIMFRPVRPIGAYVGLRALQTLFQQQGGQFTVERGPAALGSAALKRRSLNASGENLLIAMAALDDEHNASAILSGIIVDDSAEAALVADLLPENHYTAFGTRSSDTPLVDVLQLFSVSRRAYRVLLFGGGASPVGQIDLSANQVGRASGSGQQGQAALNRLLSLSLGTELRIEVSPLAADEWPSNPLGKLDSLLLRAALDGALTTEPPSAAPAEINPAQIGPLQVNPVQIGPVQSGSTEPPPGAAARLPDQVPPSPLQRLGRLLRRR